MCRKVYVDVIAKFSRDGHLNPQAIIFEDDIRYEVDRVLDRRQAASLKAGGTGMRYTVRIGGVETYVFLEENRWFVEAKQ